MIHTTITKQIKKEGKGRELVRGVLMTLNILMFAGMIVSALGLISFNTESVRTILENGSSINMNHFNLYLAASFLLCSALAINIRNLEENFSEK